MTDYGVQMYSMRDSTKTGMQNALKRVSEIGYTSVEFAGFFDYTAEQIKGWLDEYGLKCCSTHTPYEVLKTKFDETVAYHKAIGCDTLIIPAAPTKTKAMLDELIENLNLWQPLLKKEGIDLQFHNHDAVLLPNEDGKIPEFEMWDRTNINFELDTYWVYLAKFDPLELIKRMSDRVSFLHMRDGKGGREGCPLGDGILNLRAIREYALEHHMHMVVESEGCQPDGISEVARCFDHLKTLEN